MTPEQPTPERIAESLEHWADTGYSRLSAGESRLAAQVVRSQAQRIKAGYNHALRSESHQASAEDVVIPGNTFDPPLETCNACGQNYVAAMGHGCGGT